MTAYGKVKAVHGGIAEIDVVRNEACSGNCESCGSCRSDTVRISAVCNESVSAGDFVEIESKTGGVLLGFACMFLLPALLPVIGYTLLAGLGAVFAGAFAALLFVTACIGVYMLSKNRRYLEHVKPTVIKVIRK